MEKNIQLDFERVAMDWHGDQHARFTLFDNVQFIYELALARLEMEALGVEYQVTNGLREFVGLNQVDSNLLKRRLAYFERVGGELTDYHYITQRNRTRSVNQYLTHWIYPYKGKFHPQMIRAILNIIGVQMGDSVLDPFVGSGTTAVEAQLLGINCVGIDISPLSVLQSRVKTESIHVVQEVIEHECAIKEVTASPLFTVERLHDAILAIDDERVRNFYLMAELVTHSDVSRRRRQFVQSFNTNLDLMVSSVQDFKGVASALNLHLGDVSIREANALGLPFNDNSMDGIVTSPPYSIALDYIENDKHAFKALGHSLDGLRPRFIGLKGRGPQRVDLYNSDMRRCYEEMLRVLRPSRFCVIVIGDAHLEGKRIPTIQFTIDSCEEVGFEFVRRVPKIIFGLYNVMQTEEILFFRKLGVDKWQNKGKKKTT